MTTPYKDKPWLKNYDPGVPHSLLPYPSHPLYYFLRNSTAKTPNAPAVITPAELPLLGFQAGVLTYAQLDADSDALAAALVDMGVRKGDRVAIILPNCAQFAIAFFAILKAGAVVTATNPTYPPDKMRDQLKDSGAATAIVLSKFYNQLKDIQNGTDVKNVIVTNIKESLHPVASVLFTIAREAKEGHRITKHPVDLNFSDLLRQYAGRRANVTVKPDDLALFQYTGGTTGVPKAAVSTHQALVCNTIQIRAWLGQDINPKGEAFLAAVPLFHVYGMVAVLCTCISIGGPMIMVPNPRETHEILAIIDHFKPSIYMGVPAMYNAINNHPDVKAGKFNLRSIKVCVSGSAPLAPITKQRFEELTGGKLVEGFGMSECPTAVAVNPLHGSLRVGSIGLPMPDVEMRIVSLEDDQSDVPVGGSGELAIWSPNLMLGYHNMPSETDSVLRLGPDGKKWLHTGDIARMDEDGYFYIVDRKKDMALIGGFNVYPNNIEKVLLEHQAVADAGVAAVPHMDPKKDGQEMLKAWIVVKENFKVTEDELIQFCEKKLARYEVPTRIQFINELPKTLVGKVLRRELVKMEKEARSMKAQETAQAQA